MIPSLLRAPCGLPAIDDERDRAADLLLSCAAALRAMLNAPHATLSRHQALDALARIEGDTDAETGAAAGAKVRAPFAMPPRQRPAVRVMRVVE